MPMIVGLHFYGENSVRLFIFVPSATLRLLETEKTLSSSLDVITFLWPHSSVLGNNPRGIPRTTSQDYEDVIENCAQSKM